MVVWHILSVSNNIKNKNVKSYWYNGRLSLQMSTVFTVYIAEEFRASKHLDLFSKHKEINFDNFTVSLSSVFE